MPVDFTRTFTAQMGSHAIFGSAGRGGCARLSSSPYAMPLTIAPSTPSKMPFGIVHDVADAGSTTFSPIIFRTKSLGR